MTRSRALVLVCSLVLGLGAGQALAQQAQSGQPEMTAEQKAMMEAWMKVATPGDDHKFLDPMVGSWNVKMTSWETPGGPPTSSTGTTERVWVLGGRFVQESFKGEFSGMPFEGLGYTGYDNVKKKYTATWMDSMGTMTMILTGSADRAAKTITMSGQMDDVMTGKPITVRSVTRLLDKDKQVYEMYGPDKSGTPFKMMEVVYSRK
ncbi:MAG TPA: DUF1579 domain-containing protein [Thermoanaerobaculaceae bacterium]|nr:DUF1579 domain-containing protein [Thermoanaerobaculaceae bacterium]HPS77099.1 DUF1579 domain-containing protein [Thermoanaerobaculaceae bacterium]